MKVQTLWKYESYKTKGSTTYINVYSTAKYEMVSL